MFKALGFLFALISVQSAFADELEIIGCEFHALGINPGSAGFED
jgi:hypothetical protein